MQSLGMIVTAGLGVLVLAEGAYIVRTRSQMASLAEKVEALSAAAATANLERAPAGYERGGDDPAAGGGDLAQARRAIAAVNQLPPPRFNPNDAPATGNGDPLPLPSAIGSPEAREQLRQFVVAQLARERQEARVREEQRMQERNRERRIAAIKPLGLSSGETDKFLAITDKLDAARTNLRARVEAGELDRQGVRQQMNDLRASGDRELSALLGDARMKQYEQIRREQGPPEGFGRGLFGGGGPGGGGWQGRGAAAAAPPGEAPTAPTP
jgi:hypothetical protein